MKLDKAIKLLHKYRHIDDDLCIEDVNAALELGIEALKRFQIARTLKTFVNPIELPGEDD